MSRLARYKSHRRALQPGTAYHVTGHAHDDERLFSRPLDFIVFLSYVAEAASHFGVVISAFCLMSTHFHLVPEDSRGVLSQFMHRVLSGYASYYNRTRGYRRRGAILDDRFFSSVLDSDAYFRASCAYTHLNPVRTSRPLAATAEEYKWSSAGFVLAPETLTAADFCESLLQEFGGLDALLQGLPPCKSKVAKANRRKRFEALLSGQWLDRSKALWGRSPAQYRQLLEDIVQNNRDGKITEELDIELLKDQQRIVEEWSESLTRECNYTGVEISDSLDIARDICDHMEPIADSQPATSHEMLAYILWRFTSATEKAIGKSMRIGAKLVTEAIDRVRMKRLSSPGWSDLLRRIEWSLRWKLKGGPCRA